MYSLLEGVMYRIRSIMDAKDQTIHLDSPHFSAVVCTSQFEQVIENLLINASNFTPRGGDITISANKDEENICIRIRDTGVGVPPDMEEKIFQPYVRLNKELAPGTGLGLTIVRTIIQNHDGMVWVERPEDGGSEFVLKLPLK